MAIKVTVKDVPVHFTTAYSGSRGTAPHMNIGADGGGWITKRPCRFTPVKEPRRLIDTFF
jgi:hypothetical protein